MKKETNRLLQLIADMPENFDGAYSLREDGSCAARQSSENVSIDSKSDAPGLVVTVKANTKGETVYIPACVTHGGIDDLVYNDFMIGEGADITIVAGCGVHAEEGEQARHNGIHRFFLGKGAHVLYQEKHIGTGADNADRRIDPVTDIFLEEDASLEMDTVQIRGVHNSIRKTSAVLKARAKLVVRERIMTDADETAQTDFDVTLEGEDSGTDLISRSVSRGNSHQVFNSIMRGKNRCTGHSECDAILAENGTVVAAPALEATHQDAGLIHEAAIGKIAGEQIMKLRTLGLTEAEAEERIIAGFLA